MSLPSNAPIWFSTIRTQFGGNTPVKLSNYVNSGSLFPQSGNLFTLCNLRGKDVLDNVPNDAKFINTIPVHAYSTRQLLTSYKGPVMRIRHGNNNTEANIYANNNGVILKLETYCNASDNTVRSVSFGPGSYSNWIGPAIGYTTRLYDQGTSGFDLVQTSTVLQPSYSTSDNTIVFNGTHQMSYGRSFTLCNATMTFDFIPVSHTSSSNDGWWTREMFIDGEIGGSTDDFGVTMCGPSNFNFSTGPGDDSTLFVSHDGLNQRVNMTITRNVDTGAGTILKNGSPAVSFMRNTGVKRGPNPTNFGTRLRAKIGSMVIYNVQLSNANMMQKYSTFLKGVTQPTLAMLSENVSNTSVILTFGGTYDYVIVTWQGASSGQVTGTSYTITGLDQNITYTFIATPYFNSGVSGTSRTSTRTSPTSTFVIKHASTNQTWKADTNSRVNLTTGREIQFEIITGDSVFSGYTSFVALREKDTNLFLTSTGYMTTQVANSASQAFTFMRTTGSQYKIVSANNTVRWMGLGGDGYLYQYGVNNTEFSDWIIDNVPAQHVKVPSDLLLEFPTTGMWSDSIVVSDKPYANGTYVVRCSSELTASGRWGRHAFDRNNGSVWQPNTGGSAQGQWVEIELPVAIMLSSYTIQTASGGTITNRIPKNWIIRASNSYNVNGTGYVDIHNGTSATWALNTVYTFNVPAPGNQTAYRFFRYVINDGTSPPNMTDLVLIGKMA